MPFAGARGVSVHSLLFAAEGGEFSFGVCYLNQ